MNLLAVLGQRVEDMTFPQFFRASLFDSGQSIPENDLDMIRAGLLSSDGANALAQLLNTHILTGFRQEPDSTAGWARIVDVPNYLQADIARVDVPARLERVPRGQAAPSVGFGLGPQGWRLARFGCRFEIDAQDLADQQSISLWLLAWEEIGRAARRLIPDLVYSTLLTNAALSDGRAIFHMDRTNLNNAALADTSLDAAMAAIIDRTDTGEDGQPVHRAIQPGFLVVPGALVGLARRLNDAMGGLLTVRGESRLSSAGLVDPRDDTIVAGSATNWLLTCPAAQAAGVVVGVLPGKAEPTIRQYALERGQWGRGCDVSYALACTVVDARVLYWSTGA